jgi:hypothetical protein
MTERTTPERSTQRKRAASWLRSHDVDPLMFTIGIAWIVFLFVYGAVK